jgi:hypothetical protein
VGVQRIVIVAAALASAAMLAAVAGVRGASETPVCDAAPVEVVATQGGAEDLVALRLADGRTRIFVRDVCRGSDCGDRSRIARLDVGADGRPGTLELAWRPPAGPFEPLGMSLVTTGARGDGTLYLIDKSTPGRIWRLAIEGGEVRPPDGPWAQPLGDEFAAANDLQAVGDHVYVTRFDQNGFVPGRGGSWPGVLRVEAGGRSTPYAHGIPGANGIVDLGEGRDLLMSDYWARRLRFVAKDPGRAAEDRFATGRLPIHPDNLTLDGDRVLIAGQQSVFLAGFNILAPSVPSPSRVLATRTAALAADARAEIVWEGGWGHGRSVSVAVPIPGGLALGQIRTPGVLIVRCRALP